MTAVEKTSQSNNGKQPGMVGITISRELVTPERAQDLLSRNTQNRRVYERHVAFLAASMERGEWKENGETIKIAPSGELLDGQHRLNAIVQSGCSQWMFIAYNIPEDHYDSIDNGRSRNYADDLHREGVLQEKAIAAAVRHLWLYRETGNFRTPKVKPSRAQLAALLEREPGILEAAKHAESLRRRIRGLRPSVLSTLYYIFSEIDYDDAVVFFDRLASRTNLAADDPIYRLSERLISGDLTGGGGTRHLQMQAALTIKAWNYYREGRTVRQLVWRPGGAAPEPFPKPV